jgi:hypothetical protein
MLMNPPAAGAAAALPDSRGTNLRAGQDALLA